MERKIGETFEYEGKKLKAVEASHGCDGCFFKRKCRNDLAVAVTCAPGDRTDKKFVVFVEVNDEQPKEQAEQSKDEQPQLNLCEILKNCPEGTGLWSDNYGIVKFVNVGTEWDTPIRVKLTNGFIARYTEEGWCDKRFPASCLLWPSKDCRDWSKFSAPWLKKERFDPKTLKPFDKVLCWNGNDCVWECDFFSYYKEDRLHPCVCINGSYICVIPYNDETQKFAGTSKITREYYRYWED